MSCFDFLNGLEEVCYNTGLDVGACPVAPGK